MLDILKSLSELDTDVDVNDLAVVDEIDMNPDGLVAYIFCLHSTDSRSVRLLGRNHM